MEYNESFNETFEKMYTHGYEKVLVYIYYAGDDSEVFDFVKHFQMYLDNFKVGSQFTYVSKSFENKLVINNCYRTNEDRENWTDYCYSPNNFNAIKIKKLPEISPKELLSIIKSVDTLSDAFFEIFEVVRD